MKQIYIIHWYQVETDADKEDPSEMCQQRLRGHRPSSPVTHAPVRSRLPPGLLRPSNTLLSRASALGRRSACCPELRQGRRAAAGSRRAAAGGWANSLAGRASARERKAPPSVVRSKAPKHEGRDVTAAHISECPGPSENRSLSPKHKDSASEHLKLGLGGCTSEVSQGMLTASQACK